MNRKHPLASCEQCPLYDRTYVPSAVAADAVLAVIGEAPGEQEARKGIPLIGPSGQLLAAAIHKAGGDVTRVSRYNAVACRPPDNQLYPNYTAAIKCCEPRLLAELAEETAPKWVALGKTPSEVLLTQSGQQPTLTVSQRRGRWFKTTAGKDWISTWHPAYVLRKPSEAAALISDIAKAYRGPATAEMLSPPQVVYVFTLDELRKALAKCKDDMWVAFDIETDNVQWYETKERLVDTVLMVVFAWSKKYAVVVDADLFYDEPEAVAEVERFFRRTQVTAHNGKFDNIFLKTAFNMDVKIAFDHDTMLMHYTLDEQPGKQGLKYLAQEVFALPDYEKEMIAKYLRTHNDQYSKIPYKELAVYAAWDVVITLQLRAVFEQQLRDEGLYEWPFMKLLMPAQATLTQVELGGIHVDVPYLEAWTERMREEAELYANEFREMVGKPDLNMNSSVQMAKLFYDELGLPDPGMEGVHNRNRIKARSTDKNALKKLEGMHPCLAVLSKHRRIIKMINSYCENIIAFTSRDGKVFPSYKIQGAETGRLSAVDPAIQTIPRPDDRYGAILRSSFVTPDGYTFVMADYSQAELRVAAALSGDEFLLQVYRDGRDLHSEVSRAMYGPSFTKAQRVLCKMFNFSYLYGGTEHSFAEGAGLPLSVAKDFVKEYNRVMPRLVQWKDEQFAKARAVGYIDTIFGRRRRFPFISKDTLEEIRKASINMPVQSTASDLNLISSTRLMNMGYQVAILVHDSVIVRCRIDEAEEVGRVMQRTLIEVGEEFLPSVPWGADVEESLRWCPTPEEYLNTYAEKPDKLDDFELKKLVRWVRGEQACENVLQEAILLTDTLARAEKVKEAALLLHV